MQSVLLEKGRAGGLVLLVNGKRLVRGAGGAARGGERAIAADVSKPLPAAALELFDVKARDAADAERHVSAHVLVFLGLRVFGVRAHEASGDGELVLDKLSA